VFVEDVGVVLDFVVEVEFLYHLEVVFGVLVDVVCFEYYFFCFSVW